MCHIVIAIYGSPPCASYPLYWVSSETEDSMTDAPQVEAWKISSRCEAVNCVEVLVEPNRVAVRSSALRNGPGLEFDPAAWMDFIVHLKTAGY